MSNYKFSEEHFVSYLKELEAECSEYSITADEMAECYLDYIAVEFYGVEIIPMIPNPSLPSKTNMFDIGDAEISQVNQINSLKNELALKKFHIEFQEALIEYQKNKAKALNKQLSILKIKTFLLVRFNLIKIFVYDVLRVEYSVSPEFEKIIEDRANANLIKNLKF